MESSRGEQKCYGALSPSTLSGFEYIPRQQTQTIVVPNRNRLVELVSLTLCEAFQHLTQI